MNFRPYAEETDYPILQSWWSGHHSLDVPREILPRGWVAVASGVDVAASFLYMDPKFIGVIEWTTTNPECAFSADLVRAVRGLYEHLEATAKEAGCQSVISFVNPNSWERRTMAKMGYLTSGDAIPHLMFAKSLKFKHPGGFIPCP